jgi:hypothetical protein
MQEVTRRLGRVASTISRELRRNAATRSGGLEYRATTAQWHDVRAARRPKQAKLARSALIWNQGAEMAQHGRLDANHLRAALAAARAT